jgi:methyl coenzyme M reductase subunit C
VSKDFVRRFSLPTRKYHVKTQVRLANGQRVTSSTVCDITFELARHEFKHTIYVLRDLRAAKLVPGLPWLDDKQASLQFGTTHVFTLMDGAVVETHTEESIRECLMISSSKIQNLVRKTR